MTHPSLPRRRAAGSGSGRWPAALLLAAWASVATAQDAEPAAGFAPPAAWAEPFERTEAGPEGDLVVRVGDIDNVGVGFDPGYSPFSGESTSYHAYPFSPEPDDPSATDRIQIGSRLARHLAGGASDGGDGYHAGAELPAAIAHPLRIPVGAPPEAVRAALLQVFIDDFQSPSTGSRWQATLNGRAMPFLDRLFSVLDQGGPVGKLVTLPVPDTLLPAIGRGETLSLLIDDTTSSAGDGYAIDFVRLLVNPVILDPVDVLVTVVDDDTDQPLANVRVQSALSEGMTDTEGRLTLRGLPAGLVAAFAEADGYRPEAGSVDVPVRTSGEIVLRLKPVRPGTLAVRGDDARLSASARVQVMFDVSGSMLQRIGGRRKIEIARDTLASLVESDLPEGTAFGVRVLGVGGPGSCSTEQVVPMAVSDRSEVVAAIGAIRAVDGAKTPIGAALEAAHADLGLGKAAPAPGSTQLVLITDGEETCGGDPGQAIAALRRAGVALRVDIVGFDIREPALQAQFAQWAQAGGGAYFDAADAGALATALRDSLRPRWELRAAEGGAVVASGAVNAGPVALPSGRYRLSVGGEATAVPIEISESSEVVMDYPFEPAPQP